MIGPGVACAVSQIVDQYPPGIEGVDNGGPGVGRTQIIEIGGISW